jgi:hypothetical protein
VDGEVGIEADAVDVEERYLRGGCMVGESGKNPRSNGRSHYDECVGL